MKRILETELMEDEEQALAYSNADFSTSNNLFIEYILNNANGDIKKVLDIGCGPADIDIDLAKNLKYVNILAIDGSSQMIRIAKKKIENNGLSDRIEARIGKLPYLNITSGVYDVILSKDLLHHLPSPQEFWEELRRLSKSNTSIYVMDLIRPNTKEEARAIVESVSSDEPEVLQIDFYNSLLAAFSIEEIKEQLKITNFKYKIARLGNRHFILTI